MARSLVVLVALVLAVSFQRAPSIVKGQAVLQASGGTINAGSPQVPLGTAVPNALSYEVYLQSIQRADFVLPMGDTPASQTSLQIVIGGLPSGRYQAMVMAYTFNVGQSPSAIATLPQQVKASIGAGEFNFP
jgi:hypothetical protein